MRGKYGFRFGPAFARFGYEPPRMKRGDIKFLLLEVLKDGPKHGYDIIGEFETRFQGYRPSPGSVYPTLQMLEEGGFVTGHEIDGKKVYTITDAGVKLLEERGESTFECSPRRERAVELSKALSKLAMAVNEGLRNGDDEVVKKLAEILDRARRDIYSVLSEA